MRSAALAVLCLLTGCSPKIIRAARKGDAAVVSQTYASAHPVQRAVALAEAAARGREEVVRAMLARGAHPDGLAQLKVGRKASMNWGTGLMLAAINGQVGTARILLDAGASVNAQAENNWSGNRHNFYTALMFAAEQGHAGMVRLLLERGAATNLRGGGSGGRTAKDWAEKNGHAEVVRILEEAERSAVAVADRRDTEGEKSFLGKLVGAAAGAAAVVPGAAGLTSAARQASGLRQNVQTGLDAAGSLKAAADAAERGEALKIRVPASFAKKKVAVLPLDNMTNDLQGPVLFRQLLQMQLGAAGFRSEGIEFLDGRLKELGITDGGQLPSRKPDELGAHLESDALLYSELLTFKDQNLGAFATRTVEAHAWLVDARTGVTLWDTTKRRSNPKVALTGDAIKSNLASGYAGSALDKAMGNPLRPETEDVVRMLVKDLAEVLGAEAR